MKEPLVTIAICTRNRAALLEKAVRSVMAQLNDNAEILIVNNGSTDGTHVLAEHFAVTCPAIKYFFEPQAGLSIARNSALHTARGEWVVFLDDDAEVEPRWLDAYDQFFQNLPSPKIACVGGPVSPSYEIPPPKWLAANLDNWHGAMKETRRCQPSENPWGCNYAVRRELALIMGGFDSNLGHCDQCIGAYEEVAMSDWLRHSGYEIWWLSQARIKHLVAAERMQLKWQLFCAFGQGRCRAITRLKKFHTARQRMGYAVARTLAAPFHCGLNLLVALASLPVKQGRLAVNALTRAVYIIGFARGLWDTHRSPPP